MMNTTSTTSTATVSILTRTEAKAIAFEMIDALGEVGALRFHEEHKRNATAIMGLMDAMDDHGMPFAVLPR